MRDRREIQDKSTAHRLSFRSATDDDLERILEVHRAAYPESSSTAERKRWITANKHGSLEEMIVAVDRPTPKQEIIVGQAFLFRLRAWFGGRPVKVGGIASVAIAPEARGRGVARALLNELHEISDSRGDALTMLYAFRYGFYRRLGYGLTSSRKRLTFDPRSIPDPWRGFALDRVRAAGGADRSSMRELHARAASRASGWTTRSKRFWEAFLAREDRIFLVCNREPTAPGKKKKKKDKTAKTKPAASSAAQPISGYVAFELVQEYDHGETTLHVQELVADDDASRLALLGALSTLRDQVSEVTIEIAEDDPLERALVDSDRRRFGTPAVEHGLGEIVGGPMVRLEDVARAIEARGYTNRLERTVDFDVLVRDEEQEEESALGVTIDKNGRAEVGPARGGPGLELPRSSLGSILYGGLGVRDAFRLGLTSIAANSESQRDLVLERLDAVMRLPPLTPIDAF